MITNACIHRWRNCFGACLNFSLLWRRCLGPITNTRRSFNGERSSRFHQRFRQSPAAPLQLSISRFQRNLTKRSVPMSWNVVLCLLAEARYANCSRHTVQRNWAPPVYSDTVPMHHLLPIDLSTSTSTLRLIISVRPYMKMQLWGTEASLFSQNVHRSSVCSVSVPRHPSP